MLIKEPFVTFTSACHGVRAQRQVFSLQQAEPSGSLFLPYRFFKVPEFGPVEPVMGISSSFKLLIQSLRFYLEGM
jgi:hypothetical protein